MEGGSGKERRWEVGKMRRWEGEKIEVGSRNAEVGKERRWEVGKERRWEGKKVRKLKSDDDGTDFRFHFASLFLETNET
jgi:hypothetical protein